MRRVVARCRVVVDNDFAGDPDGLVGLAHHLLSPTNRVTAITSSFLNPRFAESATTAEEGVRLAAELVDVVGTAGRPVVVAGTEEAWKPGSRSPAADAIVAAALEDDDLPLFVVCGGPLTNVAAALEQEPAIAARMTLVWIGGSLDAEAFEYNRDTDPPAAEYVFSRPGLVDPPVPARDLPAVRLLRARAGRGRRHERPARRLALGALPDRRPSGWSSAVCGRSATARPCW